LVHLLVAVSECLQRLTADGVGHGVEDVRGLGEPLQAYEGEGLEGACCVHVGVLLEHLVRLHHGALRLTAVERVCMVRR